jgi:drug/metabolite transporter (DMT)-like permease
VVVSQRQNFEKMGMLALFLAIMLFSMVEITSKAIAARAYIDPFMMVFIRFFTTGVVLLAISLPGYLHSGRRLGWRDLGIFSLTGFIGITLSISLFHAAILMFENASSSAVVFSGNALFTIVLARFINRETWTWHKWVAVLLGMSGIGMFVFESGAPTLSAVYAILTMCVAACAFSLSICITKRVVAHYGPMLFMGCTSLIGSILTIPMVIIRRPENVMAEILSALPLLLVMALILTALAYALYYYGLSQCTAFAASMVFFLKPVFACFLSWLILGEKMNAWTIAGTALIIFSLSLTLPYGARKKKGQSSEPPAAQTGKDNLAAQAATTSEP